MMSTCCSKHVEAWNKHIEKECINLVIIQNYFEMHSQQNIKLKIVESNLVEGIGLNYQNQFFVSFTAFQVHWCNISLVEGHIFIMEFGK